MPISFFHKYKLLSQIIIIIFSLSLISPLALVELALYVNNKIIKSTIKESLLKENKKYVSILEFTLSDFNKLNWLKSNEFQYKNDFYDVINIVNLQAKKKVFCLKDVNEKKLKNYYNKLLFGKSRNNRTNRAIANSFSKIIKLFFYNKKTEHNFSYVKSLIKFQKVDNYINYITDIPSPPPRLS